MYLAVSTATSPWPTETKTAGLEEAEVGGDKAEQDAIHHALGVGEDLLDRGIGMGLEVLGGLDGHESLAHGDETSVHGVDVVTALGGDLGRLVRAGGRLGIREVEDGRIGLFGVNAVEDLLKVSGSAAAAAILEDWCEQVVASEYARWRMVASGCSA